MPSLRDQFQHFYMPNEETVATEITTGLVTPDTNVLLSLYRFQRGARDELLGLFEKLQDRLWIPHQVGLEFHRNRLNVIYEQESYFGKTPKDLNDSINGLQGKVRAFRARIALRADNIKAIEDGIARLREVIGQEIINADNANKISLDDHASDDVLARIDALFENRVGEPMTTADMEDARVEAQRRADAGIPPGYKDKHKDQGDPAGDYLIWRQLKMEATKRNVPVVLVTDDRKEDWYEIFKGRALGARRELREEMMTEAGVPLLIMTTETFLLQAGKYLNFEVSSETVDQAKELPAWNIMSAPAHEKSEALLARVKESVGYREETASAAAGISDRQLDYWARTGLVEPSLRADHGRLRLYSFPDLVALKVVKRLLDTGISLQQIRAAVQYLRDRNLGDLAGVTLMSDGASVYVATTADEVVDLLQGGQGVFGIALDRVWREVERDLTESPDVRVTPD
jgi:DNA-binding transcriptional MerR regulator